MKPDYQDSAVTIYHGDCVQLLAELEPLDHVITDPPYSEYVHGKSRRGCDLPDAVDGRACFSRVKEFGFESVTPVLMDSLAAFCATGARRWSLNFCDVESSHLWKARHEAAGLDYVRTGAWIKRGATPQFTGDRPAVGFEAIVIVHPPGRKRWNGGGRHALWDFPIVLNRSHDDPRLHTTQKPLPLMKALLSDFTDPGETILDPFMGSGTTLRAAKDMGRKAIGIEIEEKYCEIAARRMSQGVLAL